MSKKAAKGEVKLPKDRVRQRQILQPAGADDRNRQARGTLRRQQILDAAVELFAEKGYRGSGLAALGERVGMTPTGLLYYFGTKKRLLLEVVAERDRVDALENLTLDSLRDMGRHNVETSLLTRLYAVLCAESFDPGDPLHYFFVDRYQAARDLVAEILENERQVGRIRQDTDIEQIAHEIIGVLMGLEIQWLVDPEHVDLAQRIKTYIERLIFQLAPEEDEVTTSA
jgi:AcrR family transcriptional regulator